MATVRLTRVPLLAVLLALLLSLTGASTTAYGTATRRAQGTHAPTAVHVGAVHVGAGGATRPPARLHSPTRRTARTVLLRPGDTLWELAHRYGTTVAALQRANHLGTSTLIRAGDRLTIPAAGADRGHRPKPHTDPAPAPAGRIAVAFARGRLGSPYRWGGTGSGGYDCSGLVQAAWNAAGVRLPRTAAAQAGTGSRTSRARLRPGDLVFTSAFGHVQLYAGDGRVIEAAHTGTRVRYAPLPAAAAVNAYVRVDASAGTRAARTTAAPVAAAAPTGGSARRAAVAVFGGQYGCAAEIIARESGWRTDATNPTSGAYGLAQAVPGSKMARYGGDWRTDPITQLRWMRSYVTARYGSTCAAWAFWQTHHWY
ncbi:NlpC/P60 family protein [Streptomyces sp.]|uniref:aggregation-promoting factor C-terminal-like domain-containing protein n=1 Tax=Streptomyces sp. TaxID=1931 RepID=UPI0025EE4DF9|nr:NlpC/P60 family protein [Streptomyces sp.]